MSGVLGPLRTPTGLTRSPADRPNRNRSGKAALLPYPWVGQKRHIAHYGFPARSDPSAPVDLPTSVVRRIPCGSGGPAIRGAGRGLPASPVGSATPTPARGNRD